MCVVNSKPVSGHATARAKLGNAQAAGQQICRLQVRFHNPFCLRLPLVHSTAHSLYSGGAGVPGGPLHNDLAGVVVEGQVPVQGLVGVGQRYHRGLPCKGQVAEAAQGRAHIREVPACTCHACWAGPAGRTRQSHPEGTLRVFTRVEPPADRRRAASAWRLGRR